MRRILVTFCLAVAIPSVARAADSIKSALSVIPEEAVAFVCAPSLQQLDGDVQLAIANLGLQQTVPPQFASPLGLMKMFLMMGEGLDPNGAVAVVIMPFENAAAMNGKSAMVFPASDPQKLLQSMGGQAGEGGVWNFMMMGKPMMAMTGEKRIIVGDVLETVKAIAESKGDISSKFKAKDLKPFKGLDLVFWADGDGFLKGVKDMVDLGLMGISMAMTSEGGAAGAAQAEGLKQQVDMFFTGTESALMGVSLDPAGVGLRFALTAKPGTELARQLVMPAADGPLLAGLPAGRSMLAVGQVFNTEALQKSVQQLDPYFQMGEGDEAINAEQLGILKNVLRDWAPMNRGMRFTVDSLPPSPNGVIGLAVLVDTTDSAQWIAQVGKAVDALKRISTDVEAQKIASAVSFVTDAEQIDGSAVAQLKFDLSKMDEVDEDDLAEMTKVLGAEGLLFRMAAKGPNLVAIGFGGGAEYMQRLLAAADKNSAPLAGTPGIEKVSGHLPSDRVAEGYLAVDQIVGCIGSIAKVVDDEDEFPFTMPELNAPLAMGTTVGKNSTQFDAFFPNEAVVAVKDMIMAMMGGPMGPSGVPTMDAAAEPMPEKQ